jgi:hypothetical protein
MLPNKAFNVLLCFLLATLLGCDKDSTNPNMPLLKLTPDNVTGKSGRDIEATLSITAPNGAKDVVIYKTINLKRDDSYGTVTATPIDLGNNHYEYKFNYQLAPEEVDSLVGFNFRFTDAQGLAAEKDLTVNTTTSGQQIIYSRKWKLISRMWTSVSPNQEDIKDCDKDNVFEWKRDSTYTVNFGANPCTFDGFNVFDTWELSEDEKIFKQTYHSLFDPAQVTVEEYRVKTLTRDKLVMEIFVDLSVFGPPYTDKEVFVYTFEPAP